jgi:hypothetical protein
MTLLTNVNQNEQEGSFTYGITVLIDFFVRLFDPVDDDHNHYRSTKLHHCKQKEPPMLMPLLVPFFMPIPGPLSVSMYQSSQWSDYIAQTDARQLLEQGRSNIIVVIVVSTAKHHSNSVTARYRQSSQQQSTTVIV